MDLINKEIPRDHLRATANAISVAVALTDAELVVAKAGLFSKKLNRYPLSSIAAVRLKPNPHTDLLSVEFRDATDMTLMFGPDAKEDALRLTEALQKKIDGRS
jgi:hypothetical protein